MEIFTCSTGIFNERQVLINGVGGTGIPLARRTRLIGREHAHAAVVQVQIPRSARTDVGVELQRTILREHTHGINGAVGAVGQGEIDDAILAAKGHSGLGHVLGQHAQTAALTTGQKHGNALLFVKHGRSFLPDT